MKYDWEVAMTDLEWGDLTEPVQNCMFDWLEAQLSEDPEIAGPLEGDFATSLLNATASGVTVLGVVVGRADTGKAAIIKNPDCIADGGILDADFWGDAFGDAQSFYDDARERMMSAIQAAGTVH